MIARLRHSTLDKSGWLTIETAAKIDAQARGQSSLKIIRYIRGIFSLVLSFRIDALFQVFSEALRGTGGGVLNGGTRGRGGGWVQANGDAYTTLPDCCEARDCVVCRQTRPQVTCETSSFLCGSDL